MDAASSGPDISKLASQGLPPRPSNHKISPPISSQVSPSFDQSSEPRLHPQQAQPQSPSLQKLISQSKLAASTLFHLLHAQQCCASECPQNFPTCKQGREMIAHLKVCQATCGISSSGKSGSSNSGSNSSSSSSYVSFGASSRPPVPPFHSPRSLVAEPVASPRDRSVLVSSSDSSSASEDSPDDDNSMREEPHHASSISDSPPLYSKSGQSPPPDFRVPSPPPGSFRPSSATLCLQACGPQHSSPPPAFERSSAELDGSKVPHHSSAGGTCNVGGCPQSRQLLLHYERCRLRRAKLQSGGGDLLQQQQQQQQQDDSEQMLPPPAAPFRPSSSLRISLPSTLPPASAPQHGAAPSGGARSPPTSPAPCLICSLLRREALQLASANGSLAKCDAYWKACISSGTIPNFLLPQDGRHPSKPLRQQPSAPQQRPSSHASRPPLFGGGVSLPPPSRAASSAAAGHREVDPLGRKRTRSLGAAMDLGDDGGGKQGDGGGGGSSSSSSSRMQGGDAGAYSLRGSSSGHAGVAAFGASGPLRGAGGGANCVVLDYRPRAGSCSSLSGRGMSFGTIEEEASDDGCSSGGGSDEEGSEGEIEG